MTLFEPSWDNDKFRIKKTKNDHLRREEQIVRVAPEVLNAFKRWQNVEGIRLVELDNGSYDLEVTRDIELARLVEHKNDKIMEEAGLIPSSFKCSVCGHMADTPMHELGCDAS